ncbi:DNA-binding response regulator [Malaciobacter canalis]|jgi:DNA-binding response OmpR family regulator|uniref:DNA-binding response OmpR family regulator n=2 Tax=Malaciobacter TaxID=2321114 RepID=A0AB36ZUR0_9BACT|nr:MULTISPECIES: response regulator transcription factor [Malaciobacter]PHO08690.1 DNA-binding response regulator [Malaciobacter canalis]PPK60333.1 DNA-binding response OmpR family regulator [Malaciobacter marinus]QEE31864.1 two-component system response regulator [Malaciobacter canalis]SKB63786.1 DNA-binding response regulator, OmpR family, contains REC and winged-helix (wHTH) domain [Malaciobacter marinus]
MKILVLEDNLRLLKLIKSSLNKEDFVVDCFDNGQEALENLENGYKCFILDINVPSIDGITILEYIRMNHKDIPVLIISSNHDLEKIEKSYKMGCDDYIKKPFYIFELIQKVKKLCSPTSSKYELTSNTIFDIKQQKLYINGVEVFLTKKEILFLELFSQDLHHVASYDEIVNYVWEGEETNLTNIRAMIKRLRKKLPIDSIVIVKGMGYSLNKEAKFL